MTSRGTRVDDVIDGDIIEVPSVIAEPEPDTPPAKSKKTPKRRSGKKPTYAQITSALDGMWLMGGGALMAFDPYCGSVLVTKGPEVTAALVELAKVNPAVKKALEGLVTTSAWGGVALAVAGVVGPIAAHHRILPAPVGVLLGPSAEELEAAGIDSDRVYQMLLGMDENDDGLATDEDYGATGPHPVE